MKKKKELCLLECYGKMPCLGIALGHMLKVTKLENALISLAWGSGMD